MEATGFWVSFFVIGSHGRQPMQAENLTNQIELPLLVRKSSSDISWTLYKKINNASVDIKKGENIPLTSHN